MPAEELDKTVLQELRDQTLENVEARAEAEHRMQLFQRYRDFFESATRVGLAVAGLELLAGCERLRLPTQSAKVPRLGYLSLTTEIPERTEASLMFRAAILGEKPLPDRCRRKAHGPSLSCCFSSC